LEFAFILKHVKFPVNFYFALDLNYSEDLELIAEIFSKKWGGGGKGEEETMFKKWTFPYRPDRE
jgi:hypothetical protein